MELIRFACAGCGQYLSATRAQIGVTGPCPNCNVAVTVPKTSTLPPPALGPLVRFACASCGQHISATRDQSGMVAPCPNCNAAIRVPTTSTLPVPRPAPLPALLQTKLQKKKRYETTVILIDDYAAVPEKTKKLTNWTDDFTDARNWDHKQERSVFKENRQGRSDLL